MRILTFRRIFTLAAIGVAYVHGKRGGDASFASISDTLRHVWSSVAPRIGLDKPTTPRPAVQRTASPSRMPAPNGLSGDRPPRPQGT